MQFVARKLRLYLRIQLPVLLTLALSLSSYLNWGLAPDPAIKPLTTLICLFYWACYWPRMLHPAAIFLIGVIEDVIAGAPVGISPLLYLVVYSFILSQRRLLLKEPFPVVWGIFGISTLSYVAVTIAVYAGLFHRPWELKGPLIQWGITFAIYPFIHQLCIMTQEYLVKTTRVSTGRRY